MAYGDFLKTARDCCVKSAGPVDDFHWDGETFSEKSRDRVVISSENWVSSSLVWYRAGGEGPFDSAAEETDYPDGTSGTIESLNGYLRGLGVAGEIINAVFSKVKTVEFQIEGYYWTRSSYLVRYIPYRVVYDTLRSNNVI